MPANTSKWGRFYHMDKNVLMDDNNPGHEKAYNYCLEKADQALTEPNEYFRFIKYIIYLGQYHATKGRESAEDKEKAEYWLDKAAEIALEYNDFSVPLSESFFIPLELGKGYGIIGKDNPEDYKKAEHWFNKACETALERKDAELLNSLANVYGNGKYIKKDLQKLYEYTVIVAGLGHEIHSPGAQYTLKRWHRDGFLDYGVLDDKPDFKTPVEDLVKAADSGDSEAMRNLAARYATGRTVKKDRNLAREYMVKAAEHGNKFAKYDLSHWYKTGNTVPRDEDMSTRWLIEAAETGLPAALYDVGIGYIMGDFNRTQDFDAAISYILKAAEKGYARAYYQLASLYFEGKVIEKDLTKAVEYMKKGEELGFEMPEWFKSALLEETGMSEDC